jgi:hypothetical protein
MLKNPKKTLSEPTIDLSAIEGDGAFPCPNCGLKISPDDLSDENYRVIETKLVKGELAELVIVCRNCDVKIRLTGFQQS